MAGMTKQVSRERLRRVPIWSVNVVGMHIPSRFSDYKRALQCRRELPEYQRATATITKETRVYVVWE
jgi:hypothetical protein